MNTITGADWQRSLRAARIRRKIKTKKLKDYIHEQQRLSRNSRQHCFFNLDGLSRFPDPGHVKKQKALMLADLRYEVLPYPKGSSARYDTTGAIEAQSAFL